MRWMGVLGVLEVAKVEISEGGVAGILGQI